MSASQYLKNIAKTSNKFKEEREYWQNKIDNETEICRIPVTKLETGISTDGWGTIEYLFSNSLCEKIIKASNNSEIGAFIILLTPMVVLLSSFTGKSDITLGLPMLKQNENIEALSDFLLIKCNVDKDDSFKSLLKKIKQDISAAEKNKNIPFPYIAELLNYTESENEYSILKTIVLMDNIHEIEKLEKLETECKFCFSLLSDKKISLKVNFDKKMHSEDIFIKVFNYLENILGAFFSNPDLKLENIEYIDETEKQQILTKFNNTKAEYPRNKVIHELFEEQAEKTPDNIALVCGEIKLTYKELNNKSNQLAKHLRNKGIVTDKRVGLMVDKSIEMVISTLAILKAGGAYLPIDSDYPQERIRYMLEDGNIDLLLAQSKLIKQLENSDIFTDLSIIDLDDNKLYQDDTANLSNINDPNSLAYIMYTSGSTGKPKGVMVKHQNVVRLVNNQNYIELNEADRILQTGAIVFDATTFELWGALLNGLQLHLVGKDVILDADLLGKAINENNITIMWLTSPLFNQLVQQNIDIFSNLKYLLVGGDVLNPRYINKVREKFKALKIVNGYGPTENTTFSVCNVIEEDYTSNIPIGKPISNSTAYILDKNNRLLPVGISGELCVGGDGLARGYLNKEDLTSEKFVSNPFIEGELMYKTGDLARWLPDGNIEFLGRIDYQVKIRGFRIEPEEIEHVLLKYENIKEAVIDAKIDSSANKFLCAYFVSQGNIDTNDIRAFLSKELPDYMIPAYFIKMEKFPLNQNGKIDMKQLPSLNEIILRAEYIEPNNETQEKMAAIWEQILDYTPIGIKDNFFILGGDSLKAMVLVSRLNKEMNINISISEIFKAPTIEELEQLTQYQDINKQITIVPIEEKEFYQLSSAQRRLFALCKRDIGLTYNMPFAVILDGDMNKVKANEIIKDMLKRHEALRTSFDSIDGDPIQIVHDDIDFEVEYEEAINDSFNIESSIKAFVRPFDLGKAPLFRAKILRLEENKHILMIDTHHIISDGASTAILINEIISAYNNKPIILPKLQYKDYAAWQQEQIKNGMLTEQEKYWLSVFEGEIPVLNLPTDYPRNQRVSFEGDYITINADKAITNGLNKIARDTETTLFMVLLSAYNILLHKYSGQEDIIIGTAVAGRPHADLQNVMGMFVNTLALRNQPSASKSFIEFIKQVKENSLKSFENQEYQFDDLVDKLAIKKDVSRNPLFDTIFILQNIELVQKKSGEVNYKQYEFKKDIAKFDIMINATQTADGMLNFEMEYRTALFMQETIERMGMHYINILKAIIENPEISISEIKMVTEKEKQQILIDFNDTDMEYPKDKTLHELFEQQVEKTPDNIAVIFEDSHLTYRDLNQKANQLANILRENEVGPDSIAAIMLERSLEMIIGIMAILKAGGAYLPIDPEYPQDRIDYMLQDSKARVLLSQKKIADRINYDNKILILDDDSLYKGSTDNLVNINKPQDLAYVIYTSGSTGKPKGTMIEHHSIVNRIKWMQNKYPLNHNDVILQKTTYTFDVSVWELLWWSLEGASVCMLKPGGEKNPEEILNSIQQHKVTVMHFVPSMLNVFLGYLETQNNFDKLMSLRQVFASGEALTLNQVEGFNKLVHGNCKAVLANLYGPTEAAVDVSYFDCTTGNKLERVPIGKPIDNIKLYVVDKNNKLQPVGVAGELCITGVGLARGYLNKPELTGEKFVVNPFAANKEGFERMYRTGDLARWHPDGNIEYLGRIDHQVKVRGFRIELGEIENKLLSHKDIKETIVIAKEDSTGNKFLCAYIVVDTQILEEKSLTTGALRGYLSKDLPDYMIPSYFIQIEKMPLTANGKVNRSALPEPDGNIITGTEYAPPDSEIEHLLVEIWQQVLGIEQIGIDDNFFELGGDSIKAIQVDARLRNYNYKVEVKNIFEYKTIREIAKFTQAINNTSEQGVISGSVELTPIQKWLFEKNTNLIHHFNQSILLYSRSNIDVAIISEVFKNLIKHHDALRMVYTIENDKVVQFNRDIEGELFTLEIFDYKNLENYRELIEKSANKVQQNIDIEKGPLVKVGLFNTNEGDYLLIIIHHLVVDGISWRILSEDLGILYHQIINKEEIKLPLKTDSFSLWSEKLKKYSDDRLILKELPYWSDIGNTSIMPLPTDFSNTKTLRKDNDVIQLKLTSDLTEKLLKEAYFAYNTKADDLLIAALALSINAWTGSDKALISLEGHGREEIFEDIDISRTIGWFTTLYPIILDASKSKDLSYQIKAIKETIRQVPNKGIGYGLLKYLTSHENREGLEFKQKPEICFNYLGQFDSDAKSDVFEMSDISTGKALNPELETEFKLDIAASVLNGQMIISFNYNKNQYKLSTIKTFADLYENKLIEIIEHCCSKDEKEKTAADVEAEDLSIEQFDEILDFYNNL